MLGSSHLQSARSVHASSLMVRNCRDFTNTGCQDQGEGHSFESPQRHEKVTERSGVIGNVKVMFQYAEPIALIRHNPEITVWREVTGHSELPKRHTAILTEAD
jgi:hypothetical protein